MLLWFGSGFPDVELRTTRLLLRPPQNGDWAAWAQVRASSRDFLSPWEPTWPDDALTSAAYRRRWRRQMTQWDQDEAYTFHLFRRSDMALMGALSITNVRRGVAQIASVGYWIGENYARQGYMTEALAAAADYGFGQLTLHRIEAACLPKNEASRGLLEKVGFRQEGQAREYLKINGRWEDHLLFALLTDDMRLSAGL